MPINGMQISPQPPPPSPPPSLLPPLQIGQIWFLVQKDVHCYETCEKKTIFIFWEMVDLVFKILKKMADIFFVSKDAHTKIVSKSDE